MRRVNLIKTDAVGQSVLALAHHMESHFTGRTHHGFGRCTFNEGVPLEVCERFTALKEMFENRVPSEDAITLLLQVAQEDTDWYIGMGRRIVNFAAAELERRLENEPSRSLSI